MNKYGISKPYEYKESNIVKFDFDDQFRLVLNFIYNYPEVVDIMMKNKDNKYPFEMGCAYPSNCNKFPCETLLCGGDCCSNGFVSRMS